jgi:hypothetical protein
MTNRVPQLVELHLSGKSANNIIDALVDELPPKSKIRGDILSSLPGSEVRFEGDTTCFISCQDRRQLAETIDYYERVYPEIEFVPSPESDK